MTAKEPQFLWWWTGGTISTKLDVIWEMSVWSWAMVRGSTAKGLKPVVEKMESKLRNYPLATASNWQVYSPQENPKRRRV